MDDYNKLGGLKHALSNHADLAFSELDDREQKIAEIMFRRLIERERRSSATIEDIAKIAQVSELELKNVITVFHRFDRCFLHPYEGKRLHADTAINISHESLIRQWVRLRDWGLKERISESIFRRLQETALLAEKCKADFLRTPELENTMAWAEREKPTLAWSKRYGKYFELAMTFLHRSKEDERKRIEKEKENRIAEEKRRLNKKRC